MSEKKFKFSTSDKNLMHRLYMRPDVTDALDWLPYTDVFMTLYNRFIKSTRYSQDVCTIADVWAAMMTMRKAPRDNPFKLPRKDIPRIHHNLNISEADRQLLVRLYQQTTKSADYLPYTREFDHLIFGPFMADTESRGMTKHIVACMLIVLRKNTVLPTKGGRRRKVTRHYGN